MNEQLQQKVLEWAENVEAVASKELPLFIHDYLVYKGIGFAFSILFSLLMFYLLVLVFRKTLPKNAETMSEYFLWGVRVQRDTLILVRAMSLIFMIYPVVLLWLEVCNLAQLIFSPRAYILLEFLHRHGG